MAFLTWSNDWLLGIEALDDQHKVLADHINNLVAECQLAKSAPATGAQMQRETFTRLFNEFYATTKKHFDREEALMREEGYPSYPAHVREHVMLIAELKSTFDGSLREGGCSLNPDVLRDLKSWLIAHVSHSDRDFAKFLLDKRQAVSLPDR